MLEITIRRLKMSGVAEIIVNAHHHAQQIKDFLKKKNYFDIRMEISEESTLLDTGGGLKKASYFFDDETPFFLHNADTLSTVDLLAMFHGFRQFFQVYGFCKICRHDGLFPAYRVRKALL